MNQTLKVFVKRLTNLSTRNKSLLLTSLPGEQFLDIMDTDFVLGTPAFKIVADLIQRKAIIPLCELQDPRYEKVNLLSKKLRKIARTESFIEEERGTKDLYVGYPFVRGKFSDGTPVHAPLLYFPVTLKNEKERWVLQLRTDTDVAFNQSFALAYSLFNEVKIDDEIIEKSFNDASDDVLEFHTQLYEWLKETPFRINFNQELFDKQLIPFELLKVADLRQTEKNGELKLFPKAVLGIFPQSGSYLVPDYEHLLEWDTESNGPLHIPLLDSEVSEDDDFTAPIKEEDTLTPFPLDESQEMIVQEVKKGRSIVVQGPPGSGKSQLICNLAADFMARGKTVLVVCQKRAALDVVHQRMSSIGLDRFIGLIHDFRNDRNTLYKQIKHQIDHVEKYRQENYSLDAVVLERKFIQESRNTDKLVQELSSFRKALFDVSECGISVKELYLTSDIDMEGIDLSEVVRSFHFDNVAEFSNKLKMFLECQQHLGTNHAWKDRKSFADFGSAHFNQMEQMLEDWPTAFSQQKERFTNFSGGEFTPDMVSRKTEIKGLLDEIQNLYSTDTVFYFLKHFINDLQNPSARLTLIWQIQQDIKALLATESLEFSLKQADLQDFRISLKNALSTKKSVIKGKFWDWFNEQAKLIEQVAQANRLTTSLDDLQRLDERIENRLKLDIRLQDTSLHLRSLLQEETTPPYRELTETLQSAEKAARVTQLIANSLLEKNFCRFIAACQEPMQVKNYLQSFSSWIKTWVKIEDAMSPFLTPAQIADSIENPISHADDLLRFLRKDFDILCDADQLYAGFSQTEKIAIGRLMDLSQEQTLTDPRDLIRIFDNSLRLSWIERIENKYPILRAVSSFKMKQWEEQLQESLLERQRLSRDIATIRIREYTYQDVEKNRLGNRVTYRELDHQVSKKRKVWPIRKLLEHYSAEIFPLVPCWLASPEATSAMFPMQQGFFDLVIFDESSQCYAEFGIPAAFRGKQTVIAGDSKQLQPFELYQVRYEDEADDDEYNVATDVVSLLDLGIQTLPQFQLTGHYRSISLDLIEFSNKHFYNNTLRLTPDFQTVSNAEPGIEYIKTDGIWKNNINESEVERVAQLVEMLAATDKSIGIVTFNFFQQQAIQEKLETLMLKKSDLFVKNIENVQGDERDIIIFSMGYAANEQNKIGMQFGSLNAQGGENRLNVAITRAREKIYFVSSLWPEQLATENAVNDGPRLLKDYMTYARTVSDGKFVATPVQVMSSYRSNTLLKDKLTDLKTSYLKEQPFSDITIKEGEVYKGLILTDDDLYARSISPKEPHAYLPLLLAQKKWPFQRFFSRNYWTKSIEV